MAIETFNAAPTEQTDLSQILYATSFEGGTLGNSVTTVSSIADVSAVLSNTRSTAGTQSAEDFIAVGAGQVGNLGFTYSWRNINGISLVEGDEAWWRIKVFMPAGYDISTNTFGLKWLRTHVLTSSGGNAGYVDTYLQSDGTGFHQNEPAGNNQSTREAWSAQDRADLAALGRSAQYGTWQTWEQYVKFQNIPDSTVTVRNWLDGELVYETSKWTTLGGAGNVGEAAYFITYWNGEPLYPLQAQTMWYDEFAVAVKGGGRDDTQFMGTDAEGNFFIGTGS